jgi:hypothetical protein
MAITSNVLYGVGGLLVLLLLSQQSGHAQNPASSDIDLACVGSNGFTIHLQLMSGQALFLLTAHG